MSLAGARRSEDYHHTKPQIGGYLDDALALMEERELDPALFPHVLAALTGLFAAKQVFYEQIAPSPILNGLR